MYLDELHPAKIRKNLKTIRFGGTVLLFDSIDSTNSACMSLGTRNLQEGLVVTAVDQFAGRGRMRRKWFSTTEGSLVFSVLVNPGRIREGLTILFAYSLTYALEEFCPGARIKWPNDIFYAGRKAGGVLAEGSENFAVLGMGLNVNEKAEDFPKELADTSTSLRLRTGKTHDRGLILCRIIESFERKYRVWKKEGFEPFKEKVTNKLLYIDDEVVLSDGDSEIEGRFTGITDEGYLLLDTLQGLKPCYSGDLSLRRKRK